MKTLLLLFIGAVGALAQTTFVPIVPCRVVDTRTGAAPGGPVIAANTTRILRLLNGANPCGIPANVMAYAVNVTAMPQTTLNYITVWPSGQPRSVSQTLYGNNASATVSNAIVMMAGSGANAGSLNCYSTDNVNILLDLDGYWVPETSGPQGPVGPAGPQGVPGPVGPQGPQGVPGQAAPSMGFQEDSFIGDGSTTAFTLKQLSLFQPQVFLNGIRLQAGADYSFPFGWLQINLANAPSAGDTIGVDYFFQAPPPVTSSSRRRTTSRANLPRNRASK